MSTSTNDNVTTAVALGNAVDDDALARITSYDDALAALAAAGLDTVESSSDYGNGFKLLEDKRQLVGRDFIVLNWRFNKGSYTVGDGDVSEFVSMEIVTLDTIGGKNKFVVNDGSTGILAQMQRVTLTRNENNHRFPQAGLKVEGGLTVSEYFRNPETGEISRTAAKGFDPASTFYLAE